VLVVEEELVPVVIAHIVIYTVTKVVKLISVKVTKKETEDNKPILRIFFDFSI